MYTLNHVPHILASEVNLSNLSNLKFYLFDLLRLDIFDSEFVNTQNERCVLKIQQGRHGGAVVSTVQSSHPLPVTNDIVNKELASLSPL